MKKQLSIGLILIMLITMIAPVQVFAEETQKGCLFYRLDPSTNIENPYSYSMSVSALVNGLGSTSETNLDYFTNYNYAEYNVGDTFNFDVTVSGGTLQGPVNRHYSIDTSFSQNQILTIKFDPSATGNEIGITYDALPVDVVFSHEDLSYGVSYSYEGSNTIFSNRAIGSGNYKVFYSKKEIETEIVTIEDVVVDGSINQITSTALAPDTTFDVQATSTGFDNLSSNIYYNQKFIRSLNGASHVRISPVDTSIRFDGVIGQNQVNLDIPFATLTNSIDLTKLLANTGSENNFSGYININDAYDFTDANHNPLLISYIGMGNYSLDLGNGNIFSGGLSGGYIDVNNISGSGTLTINIPELGIDNVATPVTVSSGGQPPQNNNYKGFSFNIVDPNTNATIPGVYSTYNASKNMNYIYIPENSQALVEVKGINTDDSMTDILPLYFTGSEHPQYGYDNTSHLMTLGGVQGGYGDVWFGSINNEANIIVNVYSGKMGILTLENIDSTIENPSYFSGEANYAIGYQMTNGNGSGSMSNGEVIEGKLFIPIQADALGIDYMYTVVSPTKGNSAIPQANTPFIDLTDKLSNVVNGFIDLGSSKFQSPIFKGEVYDKNNQPVDYTHVNTMVLYHGADFGLNSIFFSPATVRNSQGVFNTFYLAPFGTDFSNPPVLG